VLYYLSQLKGDFSLFNVFQYRTFRSLGAALTALVITLVIAPVIIRILTRLKLGQPIRGKDEVHKLAELHGSKKGTPTMGGLIILISLFASTLLWANPASKHLWVVLFTTFSLGLLGFADDLKKIRQKKSAGVTSRQKLTVQAFVAVVVAFWLFWNPAAWTFDYSLNIPFLKDALIVSMGWFALGFLLLVIVGSSNAVNLTDGLDGLAIGCTLTVALVYGIFAYVCSHAKLATYLFLPFVPEAGELSIFCASLLGAGLGFLWYNCHPAKVFMGDTGSLAIGGALAVVSICVRQELLLVIVGGVFVMEAVSVLLQVASFKLTGKRIFAMSPIHHHFELRGWNETTVVVRFWILSLIFALIGIATLKLR